jgi:hypothetical protein
MDSTLNLIYLTFVFKLPVASDVASYFLDPAFASFRGTLHMFVVHMTPLLSEMHLSPDRVLVVTRASDSLDALNGIGGAIASGFAK